MGLFDSIGKIGAAIVNPIGAITTMPWENSFGKAGQGAAALVNPIGALTEAGLGDSSKLNAIGSTIAAIPGVMGLTHEAAKIDYNIDPNAFLNQYSAGDRAAIQQAMQAQMAQRQQATVPNVTAPTMSGQSDQVRQQQMALAQMLQGQAAGTAPTAPSLAEMQMQRGSENAVKQQAAAIASNRGVNAGMGARLAGQAGAGIQQQNVADTAALRSQEQLAQQQQQQQQQQATQAALANVLSGTRAQDLSASQQAVGAQQTAQQMNLTAGQQASQNALAQQQLQQDMVKYYQQAMLDQAEKDRQAQIAQQQLGVQLATGQANAINSANQANQAAMGKLYGAVGGGMASTVAR